jgi:ABC-type histidine transport system ATPase subunit
MPLLEVKDLRKSYGDLEVVRGVNLSLEAGECHGLVMNAVSPGYAAVAFYFALVLTRRRLLS